MDPIAERARESLEAAGLDRFTFQNSSNFEDHAVFVDDDVALRFVSDRGELFVDIASSRPPSRFFMLDDLDIAMGWRSLSDVVTKRRPEPLNLILARLAGSWPEIQELFAPQRLESTLDMLSRAEAARGQAMEDRLR